MTDMPAMRSFFDRIHRGKKERYKKAIVATGRKVLTICYGMMRDHTAFDANKVLRPAAQAIPHSFHSNKFFLVESR